MRACWCLCLSALVAAPAAAEAPTPPRAEARPHVVKSPHGDRLDEFYWLRDDNPKVKRPAVRRYLEQENAYTAAYLARLKPLRGRLFAEMRSRVQEDDSSVPVYDGGWWYWRRFNPGADHPAHWRQRGSPQQIDSRAQPQLLLDLSKRAQGRSYYNLGSYAVSPDGQWLAWTEDTLGRRMHALHIKNLQTGRVAATGITGALEPVVWAADNRTLFYIRQDPVTLQSGPVFRHLRGTRAAADAKVFEEADKTQFVSIAASASRRHLLIGIGGFDTTETRTVPLARPDAAPQLVLARRPGVRAYADHLDERWVIRTNEDAPNFRLVQAPDAAPDDRSRWTTLVAARTDAAIEGMALFKRGIAIQERVQADSRVRLIGPDAAASPPPQPAATVSLGDNRDADAEWLRTEQTSMIQPRSWVDVSLRNGESVLRKRAPVPGYDSGLYRSARVWAPSRDGQRIPVTLAWRADRAAQDGRAPLLINGYGSYGSSYDPEFFNPAISLLDRGFVVAIAHVRGGAEMGQSWYEAGRLMNKRNTFNDFVDTTDFLVRERWGAREKVFAGGGSAGGLLMGAVANEAGDRYRGIALDVPFVDAVTTMLDETIPLTTNEWTQWGDPRQKAAYDYILSYSPYDNLAAKPYPPMIVSTGLWDSQVQYYEPAKYVARLRARKTDANPLLLYTEMAAGHGGPAGRFERLHHWTRQYAFFVDLAGQKD